MYAWLTCHGFADGGGGEGGGRGVGVEVLGRPVQVEPAVPKNKIPGCGRFLGGGGAIICIRFSKAQDQEQVSFNSLIWI